MSTQALLDQLKTQAIQFAMDRIVKMVFDNRFSDAEKELGRLVPDSTLEQRQTVINQVRKLFGR